MHAEAVRLGWYVPGTHDVQFVSMGDAAYWPGLHELHTVALALG